MMMMNQYTAEQPLHGQVVDVAGDAVADATVFVTSAPEPVPDIAAISDADGRFAFDSLPAGAYRIKAIGPDGGAGESEATLPGPRCVIRLDPAWR